MKPTKISVLSLLLVCGLVTSTSAQFYVKVGGGYSFLPVAGFSFNDKSGAGFGFGDSSGNITYKSFGMGVQPVLGFGYFVTKNIALELDGMYLIGQKHEFTPEANTTVKWKGEGFFIIPSVRIAAPLKSVSPYIRMGLVIGIPKLKEEDDYSEFNTAYNFKYEYKGGVALGMDAALGIDIKAGKMINVFVELYGMALNYAPDERVNTESPVGFVLPTETYNEWDKPYLPFGNFGGKVGVSLLFGKMPNK